MTAHGAPPTRVRDLEELEAILEIGWERLRASPAESFVPLVTTEVILLAPPHFPFERLQLASFVHGFSPNNLLLSHVFEVSCEHEQLILPANPIACGC